jgi:G:T-mismatch repair DNA endonuclease (very short patch repair protein)
LVNRSLRGMGWSVIRVWEHELATKAIHRLRKRLGRLKPTKL